MNKLIISLFIFIFSLAFAYPSSGASTVNQPVTPTSTAAAKSAYAFEEEFLYIRVLIDGHWWTYVYSLNGSFIVAIPDDYD